VVKGVCLQTVQAVPPSSPFFASGFKPLSVTSNAVVSVKQPGLPTPSTVSMKALCPWDNMQPTEIIQLPACDAAFDLETKVIEFA
jgi:hypothetical protein